MKFSFLRRGSPSTSDGVISDPTVQPQAGEIVVYGTAWCGDCRRTKRFLDRHQVPYRWIDVDQDRSALERVLALNRGVRSVPTLVFADGSTLTEPSDAQLAHKLGVGQ